MGKFWIAVAGVLGGIGVGLGAFGAHALRDRLTERDLEIFETAVRYHQLHAVVLLAVGIWALQRPEGSGSGPGFSLIAGAFTAGVVVFSGSLYLLVLTQARWLGAVTPLGGLALMAGWALLAVRAGLGAR